MKHFVHDHLAAKKGFLNIDFGMKLTKTDCVSVEALFLEPQMSRTSTRFEAPATRPELVKLSLPRLRD